MGKVNQLKAGSVMSYFQILASLVISLVYTPVMLRMLGQAEYGIYSIATGVVSYLSVLDFGFGSSYIRFYSRDKAEGVDTASTNGLFLSVFLFLGLVCLIAGFTITYFAELVFDDGLTQGEIITLKKIMIILTISTSITLGSTVFASIIIAHEKFIFQKAVNILKTIMSPFVTWILLSFGFRSVAMTLVTAIITFLVDLFNIIYCFRVVKVRFKLSSLDFIKLKEVGAFSAFVALNSFINQINWHVDKIILGRYCGSVVTAVYSLSAYINTLYMQVSTAVSSVFVPRVNRLVANGVSSEELTKLFTRIGRYQLMVLLPIVLGFIFLGQAFVSIWAPEGYEDVYVIGLLLIIPATIPYMQNIGISIQTAMAKHQVRAVVYSVMALSNLIISIPLAKAYGGIGSALGTSVSLFLGNGIFMNIYYHKSIGINIISYWKSMLSFVPTIFLSALLGLFINKFAVVNNYIHLFVYIFIFVIVYVLCIYKFTLNNDEKDMFLSIVKKVIRSK